MRQTTVLGPHSLSPLEFALGASHTYPPFPCRLLAWSVARIFITKCLSPQSPCFCQALVAPIVHSDLSLSIEAARGNLLNPLSPEMLLTAPIDCSCRICIIMPITLVNIGTPLLSCLSAGMRSPKGPSGSLNFS